MASSRTNDACSFHSKYGVSREGCVEYEVSRVRGRGAGAGRLVVKC